MSRNIIHIERDNRDALLKAQKCEIADMASNSVFFGFICETLVPRGRFPESI
jgi:hypothetical protein